MESGEELRDALEKVFERIRETGEDNLDMVVSRFIQGESAHPDSAADVLLHHQGQSSLLNSAACLQFTADLFCVLFKCLLFTCLHKLQRDLIIL